MTPTEGEPKQLSDYRRVKFSISPRVLIQTRSYSAFSYQDIADALGHQEG